MQPFDARASKGCMRRLILANGVGNRRSWCMISGRGVMPGEPTIDSDKEHQGPGAGSAATELTVSGMTCGNCARHVTEAIQSVPGVSSAMVALEEGKARVRWVPGEGQNLPAVIEAVEKAGYEAKPIEPQT